MKPRHPRRLTSVLIIIALCIVVVVAAGTIAAAATDPTGTLYWAGNGSEWDTQYGGYTHWVIPNAPDNILSAEIYVEYADGTIGPVTSRDSPSSTIHFDVYGWETGGIVNAWVVYTYTGDEPTMQLNLSHSIPLGALTVEKVLENAPGDTTEFEFTLTLVSADPSPYPDDQQPPASYQTTFTLSGGESATITGLWPGDYSLTETDPGAQWTVSGTGNVTVTANENESVTVTNTREDPALGSLTIYKSILGDDVGASQSDFQVTLRGPDSSDVVTGFPMNFPASGPITVNNLVPGVYTVEESAPGYPWAVTGGGNVTVVADQTASVTVTNTASTTTTTSTTSTTEPPTLGSLRIQKVLVDSSGEFTVDEFRVRVSGPGFNQVLSFSAGGVILLTGLTPGAYTVAEIAMPSVFFDVLITNNGFVTVSANEEALVTVTNTRTPPITTATTLLVTTTTTTTTEPPTTTTTSTSTTTTSTTTTTTTVQEPVQTSETTPTVIGGVTTVPTTSGPPTSPTVIAPASSTPVPSGVVQTGGGGTSGPGAGTWLLAGLATTLGLGLVGARGWAQLKRRQQGASRKV